MKGLRKRTVKFTNECPHGSENCPCMYHEVEEEIEITTTRDNLGSIEINIGELLSLNIRVGDNHIDKYIDPKKIVPYMRPSNNYLQ